MPLTVVTATCSTTGALEAAYAQEYGKNISLSEQQLVDCAGAFNNSGCNGGLPSQAFEYIKYNGGLETDKAYPYTAEDGVCKFSAKKVAIRVVETINITLVIELIEFSGFHLKELLLSTLFVDNCNTVTLLGAGC